MKVVLNPKESVTVKLHANGGSTVWVRARGSRSPAHVARLALSRFDPVSRERLHELLIAGSISPSTMTSAQRIHSGGKP